MRKELVQKNSRVASMATKQEDNTPNSLELSEGQLEAHFRRLNLAHTRRIYKEVADRAEKESWSYRDFLALLLAEEVARRKQTRLQRCTRSAHFPFFKTIDEFDFTLQSTLRESVIGSYLGLDFVTEGRSLILHGKTGRGKTHLAVAIGYRAIQNGFETLFTTAAELIEDLSNASKRGNLQESLATYTHPHTLIIDEVGYLTYGPDAANVLFHVVNDRHLRKRPMIFTTNKPLNEWGKVLHDEDMAAAILDRVLERGRFIHLDGPSGRTRHLNLDETLPGNTKRLRISGISGSDFPEPTPALRRGALLWHRHSCLYFFFPLRLPSGFVLFAVVPAIIESGYWFHLPLGLGKFLEEFPFMTWKRVMTALVLIPVVVGLVLFTPTWVVAMATAAITVLALWEYFALGDAIGHRAYRLWTAVCSLLFIYSQWIGAYNNRVSDRIYFLVGWPPGERPSMEWYLFLFVLGLTMFLLWTKRPLVEALPAAGISSSAILLVAFPLSYAVALHRLPRLGPKLLLFALVLTWVGDTTAYFVGRSIGKHALSPHLSPNKTWEGTIASMIGSLLVGYVFSFWLAIPLVHLMAMAAVGNVAGQMGDLLESAYKRSAGVKDSGGLLPGHGGVLDRIDALILCIPVIWYYLVLVNPPVF